MNHLDDITYMRQALALAETGLGRVWPNPAVGCVIVSEGVVAGQARTADGGRPHAEAQALAEAGDKAKGATAYISLEPCNTHGKTPPCVGALIDAGISRVVIACRDPFQKDSGGIGRLTQVGIEVTTGVCEDEALALNEGFFKKVTEARPLVTAKLATSLDGCIATRTGESKWITGVESRRRGHELRAGHDAILVGIGTVLADDPLLTVRLPDHDGFQPVRVVIDRDGKLPADSNLLKTGPENPVWVITKAASSGTAAGIKSISLEPDADDFFSPKQILKALADQGITRLLIEGGGETIARFLQAGLVDRLYWFRAPKIIGGDGVPCLGGIGVNSMDEVLVPLLEERTELGNDLLEIWRFGE